MFKSFSKIVVILFIMFNLNGCITYALIRHAAGAGEEYTATQVSTMSNYGLVECKKAFRVSEKSKADCAVEISKRIDNKTMSQTEYSQYEENTSQANASMWQKMQQASQQRQALEQQQEQLQIQALQDTVPQQPIDVNVHHGY